MLTLNETHIRQVSRDTAIYIPIAPQHELAVLTHPFVPRLSPPTHRHGNHRHGASAGLREGSDPNLVLQQAAGPEKYRPYDVQRDGVKFINCVKYFNPGQGSAERSLRVNLCQCGMQKMAEQKMDKRKEYEWSV